MTARGARSFVLAVAAGACATPAVTPRELTRSRAGAFEAALSSTPTGAIASWHDIRHGNGEIYMRRIGPDGSPEGAEIRLTHDAHDSFEPSIDVLDTGRVGVAWYDKAKDGGLGTRLGVWDADGTNRWVASVPAPSRNPVVRASGATLVVAWIHKDSSAADEEAVWLGRWRDTGEPLGMPVRLGPAHETTWNLNLAIGDDGAAWVVFDAVAATRASELFLARVDGAEVSLTRLSADDGWESKYPDIAVRGGRVAIAWFDAKHGATEVYLFAGDRADLTAPIDAAGRRVTETAGASIGAYVAWNRDRLGLAWSDDSPGQHEIYFQPFDARGIPLTASTRVTRNRMSSLIPAIEPWRDGFALAWTEFVPSPRGGHDGTSEIAFALVE